MGAGKNKIQNRISYINHKEYNLFKEKYPNTHINYNTFITVLKESTKTIRDHVLDNPLGFKLPYNLGYIAVDKFKAKKSYVAIDWVNTKRLGKHVPLTNLHSFGYMYKIKFYPNLRILPIKNYALDAHRVMKRMLAYIIKNDIHQYINIDRSYYSRRFRIDNLINKDN